MSPEQALAQRDLDPRTDVYPLGCVLYEWLNRGIDQRDIYIPENFFDPLLDPLRKDPRFGVGC